MNNSKGKNEIKTFYRHTKRCPRCNARWKLEEKEVMLGIGYYASEMLESMMKKISDYVGAGD